VAFGPERPGWGSWDWVGADLRDALGHAYETRTFSEWDDVEADVTVVVKHAPPADWVAARSRRGAVVYCPVDYYGEPAHLDSDAPMLRRCARVLVHSERLRRYFEPYAPVGYLDHHVKFAAPVREEFKEDGPILWVGVRSNLPPLVAWVNAHGVPGPLDVLTNLENPARPPSPAELGFGAHVEVRVHDWSPHRHIEMTMHARAVIDIKGNDFRARHKPPAKGIDVIASGVPLAMNPESSTVEHLARMGFRVAGPLDHARWLSRDYWEETRRFGLALRELLTRERVAARLRLVIDEVRRDPYGSAWADRMFAGWDQPRLDARAGGEPYPLPIAPRRLR